MQLLCPDSQPSFLGFFDLSIAPHLLFYTYIPTIIISLLLGFFVLSKDKKSLPSKLLFAITLSFSLWVLDILVLWVSAYNHLIMFGWQITPILETSIFIFSIYFTYVFTDKNRKDISDLIKYILLSIGLIVFIFIPTSYNIVSFDIVSCEGVLGSLWGYMYIFEFIAIAWICSICIRNYRSLPINDVFRKQVLYFSIGISSFLMLFVFSNILGETLEVQEISFIGSLGMVIFLGFLSYLIVKYRSFNTRIIGAQALVIALIVLIASTLLVEDLFYSEIIIAITLVMVIGLGYSLTQGVKREVDQREYIEKLAKELAEANEKLKELDQMKSEFLSLATHQIRSPLTAIRGYTSMLLEGDFGPLPYKAKDAVEIVMKSCVNLVTIVGEFLDISRIERGIMVYNKERFDMRELVKESIKELKPNIDKAGLTIETDIPEAGMYTVLADKGKMKQIVGNLIDNAIKYTVVGTIKVWLEESNEDGNNIRVSIKDSGIGIPPMEMGKLFAKFSRTKDAHKTNVTGTGLGLYIAKKMIEAQGGSIWVTSEGENKGSTFIVELPKSFS